MNTTGRCICLLKPEDQTLKKYEPPKHNETLIYQDITASNGKQEE
jgi:hypothetical protein